MVKYHQKKEVSEAIEKVLSADGWSYERSHGHNFMFLLCPRAGRDGCSISVFSTPTNPGNHAKWIMRKFDACPHTPDSEKAKAKRKGKKK